ncbi:GNAT family N-acetyltransferase [Isobaculum melis]|uniref:Acetyltransferase (GNAT) domain-containing protein n=1 Tax=Isobaculum melis TaxID=142588 RepID=A0A1H9PNL7_9LACT|nr:GNAT family N-acetyltransferase [Isobaculum melis]SER49851.1 Acetyltransferase (GNAT) domain-containing protein [Isobaculum melis]
MKFQKEMTGIKAEQLVGFFVDWPNPPNQETHLALLQKSDYRVLAIDEATNQVVGFITAISDQVLCAYIPLLEVLPAYQKLGVGKELMTQLLTQLQDYYMIDLLCDADLQEYYETFNMYRANGMLIRNYGKQSGR